MKHLAFLLAGVVLSMPGWVACAAEAGVADHEVLVGQSGVLSGPLAPLAVELQEGANLYIERINASGGVHGRRIRILSMDDAYDPKRAADNTLKMIEQDRVFALFGYSGTPTTLASLPIIERHKVPLIAPFTGADVLRDNHSQYVFNVRARYSDEIEEMVRHLTTIGVRKIAVAYLNNAFGKSGLASVEAAMKKRGLQVSGAVPVEVESTQLAASVKTLAQVGPDAIILATAGKPTSDFIGAYQKTGLRSQFYALSVVSSYQLTQVLGEEGRGVVISQVMPYPWRRGTPIVDELQKLASAKGVRNLTYNHMEGFVYAKVLVEALRDAGRKLTREGLVRSLESMKGRDLGGLTVGFSQGNHNASTYVDLTIVGRDGKLMR